jgi:hypothetical protein
VPTSVRRKAPVSTDPKQIFAEHIVLKRQASVLTTRADALKNRLKGMFTGPDVYVNDNGSKFIDFEETVNDGKEDFKGIELRRSVPVTFDEDAATKILKSRGVYEQALTPVIDQEKVYLLAQEGKISEKDIDKMFVKGEQWAFWPVKGEVL